jgi:NAD(P)H-hydrate epimerase
VTLPDWLDPLPDAETMRAVDRWAIEEQGVEGLALMERAGTGVTRTVERLAPDGPVTVVCGKGNNGGDGLVVARLLRESGRAVRVVCAESPASFTGDAQANLRRLPGPPPVTLDGASWSDAEASAGSATGGGGSLPISPDATIVDALLGTGFRGEPGGAVAVAIESINAAQAPVVSVDVPSGVDASTGTVASLAVSATVTVTFHLGKPGLWIFPGKARAGAVERVDIGIPRGAPMTAAVGLISSRVIRELPSRTATMTKFDSGAVLVVGGSRGLTGAPSMAARACMRAGAGYVTACLPASQQAVVAGAGTPELMTRGLPDEDGCLTAEGVEEVLEACARASALALGPGLGRAEAAADFARAVARRAELPLVLDADGLGAHAGRLRELSGRAAPTVLTPHEGELGRLLGVEREQIARERLRHAREAAGLSGAIVALKGDDTIVADPAGRVAVSPGATPALATAGTGDVLTGVIAALIAQGLDAFAATAAGVWLHAQAGREAARRTGAVEGVIASDVIEALPAGRGAGTVDAGA